MSKKIPFSWIGENGIEKEQLKTFKKTPFLEW